MQPRFPGEDPSAVAAVSAGPIEPVDDSRTSAAVKPCGVAGS